MASLDLPPDLKRRVWSTIPRPTNGFEPVYVRRAEAWMPTDPWGMLEHVAPLPSDTVVDSPVVVQAKRRRVFRCV